MRQEQNIILIRNKHKLFMKETKLDQITSQESSLILNTARKFLEEEMEKFFFGEGSEVPKEFVPK